MGRLIRKTLLVTFVAAVLFGFVAAFASAATKPNNPAIGHAGPTAAQQEGTNTNPQTYTDTANDGGTAPDIRTVVVSNDANGNYTFRINVTQLTSPSNVVFYVALDTDENAATGSSGADYLIACDESNGASGLGHWNGSSFDAVAASTLKVEDNRTGLTATINKSDLGGSSALRFKVLSVEGGTITPGHVDTAPDTGMYDYDMTAPAKLTLSVDAFTAPKSVKAGTQLVVAMAAQRSDTTELVGAGDGVVTCRATAAGKRLPLVDSGFVTVNNGPAAGCVWRVWKKLRGKTIKGSITISFNGASATHTFVVKVK